MPSARAGLAVLGLLLAGCAAAKPTSAVPVTAPAAAATAASTASATFTATVASAPEIALNATSTTAPPAPTFTPTSQPDLEICSPLEGIPLAELTSPDLLKTLFDAPRPGMDDGHHGVDFAYWTRGQRSSMRGHPVQAMLAGRVAGLIPNRIPYGYAIIIETPLDAFSADQLHAYALPAPAATVTPADSLFCPSEAMAGFPTAGGERSLYLLYAHLNEPPLPQVGDAVGCGATIGAVGTTGNSVNAHLHLETRLGPAGVTLPVMAHYDNAATPQEMGAYCTWRVSGLFQMLDPLQLFTLQR